MKTCVHLSHTVCVIETDGILCDMRAEAEESVDDLNITIEYDQL